VRIEAGTRYYPMGLATVRAFQPLAKCFSIWCSFDLQKGRASTIGANGRRGNCFVRRAAVPYSNRLAEICRGVGARAYQISLKAKRDVGWLTGRQMKIWSCSSSKGLQTRAF
jgi:hypothetical protein